MRWWLMGVVFACSLAVSAQQARQRLVLRDGTFQMVLDYKVVGSVVRFHSAERNGEAEEIPLALVDLAATERLKAERTPGAEQKPVVSAELAREEADRVARHPEVAMDLALPDDLSLVVLDTFQGMAELIPLAQRGGDLNPETGHSTIKVEVNPASTAHRLVDVDGERADVQLHVAEPVFFVRLEKGSTEDPAVGSGLVVDTHGLSGKATPLGASAESRYVLERVDVRRGQRRVDTLRIDDLGVKPQRDVVELRHEVLPGGYWMKLTPKEPLLFGEYVLLELVGERALNSAVWDFGVHPDAKENVEALRPEPKRAPSLNRRP